MQEYYEVVITLSKLTNLIGSGRKAIANMTTVLSASALYMAYIRDLNPSFRKVPIILLC